MANPNPIPPPKETRWQPGQSGNPNGYSRGRRQIDDLLELIQETAGAERAISKAWLKRLLNGEFQHLKEYLDRRDGKLANKVEMTNENDRDTGVLVRVPNVRNPEGDDTANPVLE